MIRDCIYENKFQNHRNNSTSNLVYELLVIRETQGFNYWNPSPGKVLVLQERALVTLSLTSSAHWSADVAHPSNTSDSPVAWAAGWWGSSIIATSTSSSPSSAKASETASSSCRLRLLIGIHPK